MVIGLKRPFTGHLFPVFLWSVLLVTMTSSLFYGVHAQTSATKAQIGKTAAITHLTTTTTSVQFTLHTPAAHINNNQLSITGLNTRWHTPGFPDLPYYSTYIAIPPEASVHVSTAVNKPIVQIAGYLQPVPQLANTFQQMESTNPLAPFTQTPSEADLAYLPNPEVYNNNSLFPASLYTISEPMYLRDIRLVELRLYPVRYNPVTGVIYQAQEINVTVTFTGGNVTNLRPSPTYDNTFFRSLDNLLLNPEQAIQWRSLPPELAKADTATKLPIGQDTFRIELNQDGIYEISYSDLAAAGMDVNNINPNTFEMMYRGESVAYEFIGDNDNIFENGEKIRFYGWAFDGSRLEKQFVTNNVFWLWANGTPTTITSTPNVTNLPSATTFTESVTVEPEKYFFSGWTNQWDSFPNEPDAWFWDRINTTSTPVTHTYSITLTDVAASGPNATYLAEFNSRGQATVYTATAYINNNPTFGQHSWFGRQNVNVANSVPLSDLNEGTNTIKLVLWSEVSEFLYLNRITITYTRQIKAVNDQLIFTDDVGARTFTVSNLNEGDVNNVLVWNITDPKRPSSITLSPGNLAGSGPYTLTFGSNHPPDSRFIVTTAANILTGTAVTITKYTPTSLDPPSNQADWLAITHSNFMTQAQDLASYRATKNNLQTHIADIDDIINQYGYGLPLPGAIHDYLSHALASWDTAPTYVLLLGDATVNPRNLDCLGGCQTAWDKNAPTYVPTDLIFVDRFQGLVPSDHTFVLLSGNDLLPDMAIGRIAAETAAEAAAAIAKIKKYEENQFPATTNQDNLLFVADNTDSGGDFCTENQVVGNMLPSKFNQTHLCLADNTQTATDNLRSQMSDEINNKGVFVLNYRGHGSIDVWASPAILQTGQDDFWLNLNTPITILSADCLDGYFAYPGWRALSEDFLLMDNLGTAAHWSSTGLGYTFEHTALHSGFYEAVFSQGIATMGEAANYAKTNYFLDGYDQSEMYTFTLQGDPAMRFYLEPNEIYLPVVERP